MSATIAISQPKSFALQSSMLGVPLAIWAASLLVIAVAAYLNMPIITFGPLELLPPF